MEQGGTERDLKYSEAAAPFSYGVGWLQVESKPKSPVFFCFSFFDFKVSSSSLRIGLKERIEVHV